MPNHYKKIDYTSLENAIKSLEKALSRTPKNDIERDGVIQRFEYTFELAWKFVRRVFLAMGRNNVQASPKPLIREAHTEHLIDDVEAWFEFLEARNNTVHIYDSRIADKVFEVARKFPPFVRKLLKCIKNLRF